MGENELDVGDHEVAEGVEHDADEHALRVIVQPGVHEGHTRGAQGMLEEGYQYRGPHGDAHHPRRNIPRELNGGGKQESQVGPVPDAPHQPQPPAGPVRVVPLLELGLRYFNTQQWDLDSKLIIMAYISNNKLAISGKNDELRDEYLENVSQIVSKFLDESKLGEKPTS